MPRFRVFIQFIGSTAVEVEAEDADEAMDKAVDEAPQNDFGGSGWDASEWYIADEENDAEEIEGADPDA